MNSRTQCSWDSDQLDVGYESASYYVSRALVYANYAKYETW